MPLIRPQRIFPPARPGALLKCVTPQPRSHIKQGAEVDPDYLALVRQLPCLKCGVEPCGEAAHVRFASAAFGKASGMGKKPADKWALPLCGDDHRVNRTAQHRGSEQAFWADLGINPLMTAEKLFAQAPDLVAMCAVIFITIAERGK